MAYTVNITSTTTTSENEIGLNYGYFRTISGILKLVELIFGLINTALYAASTVFAIREYREV
ncbi:hypothetical protein Bhyg_14476 [Pseudolycoriella hygida]|uniref:Uncharacterized protein n=1 Tax=Pseudolycoriella hygida TaxID=35572 RepID=A0A9Q0RVP3_9DIPT|nr:hypothetical protein Bhyg_14476 [Pseudolycoriella hygida]